MKNKNGRRRAMKSNKEQRKAAKGNEEQQKAKKGIWAGKTKTGNKKPQRATKGKKVQMETRLDNNNFSALTVLR